MNVIGKTKIFKNDKGYTTSIGSKREDGSYDNMYLSVTFKKGLSEVENGANINITNGFLTFWKDKNGLAHPKIVIMGYQLENEGDVNIIEGYDKDDLPF